MEKQEQNLNGVINPFSEAFLPTWELWKEFRWQEHQFKYKGCISEQMALKHLVDLSEGFEEKAIKIVEQSIRRIWAGFFPLKETTHGTSKSTTTKKSQPGDANYRSNLQSTIDKRFGKWEQDGSEPHLKAV